MRLRLNNNLGSIVEVDFPETTMEHFLLDSMLIDVLNPTM
jgi:hypothetical protein